MAKVPRNLENNNVFKAEVRMIAKKLLLLSSCLIMSQIIGCSKGAQFEGQVVDFLTNSSVKNVRVVAVTNTDIKEEQKYARLNAQTNTNGVFHVSNALKSKRYKLFVEEGRYATTEIQCISPEENVTKTINDKIFLAELPSKLNNGFYVYPLMTRLP